MLPRDLNDVIQAIDEHRRETREVIKESLTAAYIGTWMLLALILWRVW